MYKLLVVISGILLMTVWCIVSCKKDTVDYVSTGYPTDVANIIVNKCAISGCHDNASYLNASGLNLTTWANMFKGGSAGADVIPYDVSESSVFTFCNIYSALGLTAPNIMPPVGNALSQAEVTILKNWIAAGALNNAGQVAFPEVAGRHKIYVCNQGCNQITVIDAATGLAMRYISIGNGPNGTINSAHCIRISADKQHLFVVFINSQYMEVYSTVTDAFEYRINLSPGAGNPYASTGWDIVVLSPDGTKAIVSSLYGNVLAFVDLITQQLVSYSATVSQAHGIAVNPDFTRLYVTSQTGNYISRFDLNPSTDATMATSLTHCTIVTLTKTPQSPVTFSKYDPHEIIFSPDYTKYFVTCQNTGEVRVMSAVNDSLIDSIRVGSFPQDMAISYNKPLLFCTCRDDNYGIPKCIGSVSIINYNTLQLVKQLRGSAVSTITNPYQPHGVAVDDINNKVYISSLNYDGNGPPPHHVSVCGRDGFMDAIDLNTLDWVPLYHPEVSSYPYSVMFR